MEKLTRTQAKTQTKRLLANAMLAPQTDDGSKEIVECILRNCKDAAHAERAMTRFLDTASDPRNITAELASAAKATAVEGEAPGGCPQCELDPDVETGESRYMSHVIREIRMGTGMSYEAAVRCGCVRGRWLASRDLQRAKDARDFQETRGGRPTSTAMQGGE